MLISSFFFTHLTDTVTVLTKNWHLVRFITDWLTVQVDELTAGIERLKEQVQATADGKSDEVTETLAKL